MNKDYTKKLENVIKQMLTPLKKIPFNLVIEAITGYKILPFDKNNDLDLRVLDDLEKVAYIAGEKINKIGIKRPRPNEVGNDIEKFVKDALNNIGYQAEKPKLKSGKGKSTGYPDILFVDTFNRVNYLECKTYNIKNIDTTMRSFYLSPSDNFKITQDAHHFILSYEIFVNGRIGGNNIYNCKKWKILSIENLEVDVKYEFNSDNARMYTTELILAEGRFGNEVV